MVRVKSGGNAYLENALLASFFTKGKAWVFAAHHDQKAMKNPNQEKKNTRPYLLTGLNTGIDRALWLTGFSSGADQSTESGNIFSSCDVSNKKVF